MGNDLPNERLEIKIKILSDEVRLFNFSTVGDKWYKKISLFKEDWETNYE